MVEFALELLKPDEGGIRFFDPAVGTGSFFSALLHSAPRSRIKKALGIEIDRGLAEIAGNLWSGKGLRVETGDFTRLEPPNPAGRFNLLVANPPYVRHHHLSPGDKARLQRVIARRRGIELSGLAGLYCYFLLLGHDWMAADGLAVWLLPAEFMDVNYGRAVKRYLREQVTLIHVHRFEPSDVQFDDALVSSAVLVFRNSAPPTDHQVVFSRGGTLTRPAVRFGCLQSSLSDLEKWTSAERGATLSTGFKPTLGDFFTIKRGIATGANSFFILSESSAIAKGIPACCLKPILPGPRFLAEDVIEADSHGAPILDRRQVLIDCHDCEAVVRQRWPEFWAYLQEGKARGMDQGYLASRRKPWYSQERRTPAPFLCTYMGRKVSGKRTLRFIWNRSRAVVPNVYLCLYPRPEVESALRKERVGHDDIFRALLSIELEAHLSNGRVYGGGLFKMEPKELARIDAGPVAEVLRFASCSREGLLFEPV